MIQLPTFDPLVAAPHFDACIHQIGSYSEAARRLGLKTAWAVQKWRVSGVPHDQVILFAAHAAFVSTPHQLRRDLYPHPDDGLPQTLRGRAAA